jgi:hypothetical protein
MKRSQRLPFVLACRQRYATIPRLGSVGSARRPIETTSCADTKRATQVHQWGGVMTVDFRGRYCLEWGGHNGADDGRCALGRTINRSQCSDQFATGNRRRKVFTQMTWLPAYFAAGGGEYVDIIGLHGYTDTPEQTESSGVRSGTALLAALRTTRPKPFGILTALRPGLWPASSCSVAISPETSAPSRTIK